MSSADCSSDGWDCSDLASCSSESDLDLSSGSSTAHSSSDLEDLYESFEFEEDVPVPRSRPSASAPASSVPFASARDKQLYPGANVTTFQCYLLVFQYAIRHSLSTKAFTELLQLLAVHLPEAASIPTSVYNLKRFVVDAYPELQPITHLYCSCCHRPLPSEDSICNGRGCSGGSSAKYITIPAGPQLKRVMEDPSMWSALQDRFDRRDTNISDIYDGEGYKMHSGFLSHPAHVSFILNTDGVALYRSSTVSIWPVWAVINELPPNLRFKRQHMLLLGIFYSSSKPLMNMFLRPVMDDLIDLYRNGVAVETPAGEMVAKAILLVVSVDLPARAMVTNMKQWNGSHGCLYCEEMGSTIGSDHLHRYWPYKPSTQRTHSSVIDNAKSASRSGVAVCGVKGATVLALHPTFDVVCGIVVDDLHGLYLGVTLTLLHMWLDKRNRSKPYFIGNKVKECDDRLLSISVTYSISRIPRSITEFNRWKGAELRNWLIFYSLPVLRDILPQPYFKHMALLVAAIYIFSTQNISMERHRLAKELLMEFYKEFSVLYGVASTSMNVHLLYHLPDCVKMWGPLWAYSCFHFEAMNGYLKFLFHGTKNMTKQMAFSYVVMQMLPQTLAQFSNTSQSVLTVANLLYGKKRPLRQCVTPGAFIVGGVTMKMAIPIVMDALGALLDAAEIPSGLLPTIYRVEYNGNLYYSRQYRRVKKRNSYTVVYSEGSRHLYGAIEYFVLLNSRIIAIIRPLIPLHQSCTHHFSLSTSVFDTLSYLIPVSTSESFTCSFIESFVEPCLFIDFSSIQYIAKFPANIVFD